MSVGWQCGRKVLLIFLNCVKPPIQVSGVELRIVTKQKMSQYNNTTHYNCHLIQFKYICHRSFSSIACFVNETVRTILQLQSRSHLAAQYTWQYTWQYIWQFTWQYTWQYTWQFTWQYTWQST